MTGHRTYCSQRLQPNMYDLQQRCRQTHVVTIPEGEDRERYICVEPAARERYIGLRVYSRDCAYTTISLCTDALALVPARPKCSAFA